MVRRSSRATLINQRMVSDCGRAITDRLGVMVREGGGEATDQE
ncbi:hypothetical protein ACIQVC_09990 [Streptomyces sp. NPDC101112]|jgi:hypothetical protein|nr:integrase [Streptomyces sp. JV178]